MTTAEARGQLRLLRQRVIAEMEQVHAITQGGLGSALGKALARKGAVGRTRALRQLRQALEPIATFQRYYAEERVALWAYRCSREHILQRPTDPGQTQPAITVQYAAAGGIPDRRANFTTGHWTLEIPDHALLRLYERCRGIDGYATIMEAHATLIRGYLPKLPVRDHDLYLPAGPGCFVGQMIYGEGNNSKQSLVYFRPRTWLHQDQLLDGQAGIVPGEPSLGNTILSPLPLRRLAFNESGVEVEPLVGSKLTALELSAGVI